MFNLSPEDIQNIIDELNDEIISMDGYHRLASEYESYCTEMAERTLEYWLYLQVIDNLDETILRWLYIYVNEERPAYIPDVLGGVLHNIFNLSFNK